MLSCWRGQADESLAASTGARFAPDLDVHGYKFGVEPVTGLTVYVRNHSPHQPRSKFISRPFPLQQCLKMMHGGAVAAMHESSISVRDGVQSF